MGTTGFIAQRSLAIGLNAGYSNTGSLAIGTNALQNATSIAGMILTTECIIVNN